MTSDVAAPLFVFSSVSVVLGGVAILSDLELTIPAKGITTVVGASGSGKSTLTRLTNRLIDPTVGSVHLRGADVRAADVLALRRTVGMVFQRPTLFAGTVADNLRESGVTDGEQHAAALESVGLTAAPLLGRDASALSGGEAQRICLARTLLTRPQVLVADEPTSALDYEATLALERLARRLTEDGVPILWVTHDLAQVDRIADHRVHLEAGRVVAA